MLLNSIQWIEYSWIHILYRWAWAYNIFLNFKRDLTRFFFYSDKMGSVAVKHTAMLAFSIPWIAFDRWKEIKWNNNQNTKIFMNIVEKKMPCIRLFCFIDSVQMYAHAFRIQKKDFWMCYSLNIWFVCSILVLLLLKEMEINKNPTKVDWTGIFNKCIQIQNKRRSNKYISAGISKYTAEKKKMLYVQLMYLWITNSADLASSQTVYGIIYSVCASFYYTYVKRNAKEKFTVSTQKYATSADIAVEKKSKVFSWVFTCTVNWIKQHIQIEAHKCSAKKARFAVQKRK